MTILVDMLIEEIEAEQQKERSFFSSAGNDDPFLPRLDPHDPNFNHIPRSIYFYYLRINSDLTLTVDHYPESHEDDPQHPNDPRLKWKEIPNDNNLDRFVRDLAIAARPGGGGRPDGQNFDGITWNRKAYIVIFCDTPNLEFRKLSNGNPAAFVTRKNSRRYTSNHSFYDGRLLTITMDNGDVRTAVSFINHLKASPAGDDMMGTEPGQAYQFNLFFRTRFTDGSISPLDIIIDPGGTNQGPPLEP